jgi:hypothetical protein
MAMSAPMVDNKAHSVQLYKSILANLHQSPSRKNRWTYYLSWESSIVHLKPTGLVSTQIKPRNVISMHLRPQGTRTAAYFSCSRGRESALKQFDRKQVSNQENGAN